MNDINIIRGDTCYFTIIKQDEEGNKVNFDENDKIVFSVKKKLTQTNYELQSEDATIVDGEAIISLTAEQTSRLLDDYYYDIEYTDINSDIYTLAKGTLTVEWDVKRYDE